MKRIVILSVVLILLAIAFLVQILLIKVSDVELRWGKVTPDTTEILGVATVSNPGLLMFSASNVHIHYEMFMNGLKMAYGVKRGINIGFGESKLNFTVYFDNRKMPEWWVTHLNNGEETNVEVTVRVMVDYGFLKFNIATYSSSFSVKTDLLSELNSIKPKNVSLIGPFYITVKSIQAEWGKISADKSEIVAKVTLYNPNVLPLTVSKIGFEVHMNNITIGNGETSSRVIVMPNSQRIINLKANIENQKLDDWFVTHVKNGETTEIRITFFSILHVGKITLRVFLGEYTDKLKTNLLSI